jgi:hypothetical protein
MTWTTEKADEVFSKLIRARDPICAFDGCSPSMDCSHHFERANSATRYHPENCDGLARRCHNFFHANPKVYKEWKMKQLGVRAYVDLQRLAATTMKRDEAIKKFMQNIYA